MNKLKEYKFQILSSLIIVFALFFCGYSFYINIAKNKQVDTLTKEVSSANIKDNTVVEFLIKYSNCNNFINDDKMMKLVEKDKDKIKDLKEGQLEEIYKGYGYKLDKHTSNKITFIKEIPGYAYESGKYFIGINENKVVIYNKKEDNNLVVVENMVPNVRSEDKRPITLENLKDKGNLIESFYEGKKEYQFDDKESALEYAKALCSS
ncbi:hypothetical protein [Clostridium senegalense]|uniref:hypothetical protein n=1 Tax=Clostridium senegalense TaxID=1465809 RepID=UPI001C0F8ACE|nr:hypothetical protein [Clostridium senegalense]MBU5225698.1 hypothetical protein [Clostridium senegalense]